MSIRFLRLFIIVFVILLVIECLIRLFGLYITQSEKTFQHFVNPFEQKFQNHYYCFSVKKIKTDEFQYIHYYDQLGYRNDSKTVNYADIIAFGDSFTEGMGTHQDSTWSKFLSRQLNMPIYNAGKIGSDPHFYLQEYKRLREKFKGKNILVLLNYSDIADFRFRHSKNIPKNVNISLYKYLHIYRCFSHFLLQKDYMFLDNKNRAIVLKEILNQITSTLVGLNQECRKDNKELIVLIHPLPQEYYKNLDSRLDFSYVENLVPLLKAKNIRALSVRKDMEKLVATKENWQSISWQIDGHFNAKGYEILAQTIYNKLFSTKDF